MKYSRCKWVAPILAMVMVTPGHTGLPPVEIPLATDLKVEGRQAERDCKPVVLVFSSGDCDYCILLEEEVLKPVLRNPDYAPKASMRKLMLDDNPAIRGFDGKATRPQQLAEAYGVSVTPTLLFLDSQGRELSERMVGVTSLDFYAGYLDQALDNSGNKLRDSRHCRQRADSRHE